MAFLKSNFLTCPALLLFVGFSCKMGKGSSNWSTKDQCKLVRCYAKYHEIISGAFKGPLKSTEAKEEAWKNLTSDFLAENPDEPRMLTQLKSKIDNLKTKVRDYGRQIKYHKMGGGPPPDEQPAYVQKLYEIIFG